MAVTHKIYIVDAFTQQQFHGNQAAVIPLNDWLPTATMQAIAMENNLSETAFFVRNDQGQYHIRWFSPLQEIAFCGHATLASAHVIFALNPTIDQIQFYAEAVGVLPVMKQASGLIDMSFPNRMPVAVDEVPAALYEGLSITPQQVLKNQQAYFAIYEDEKAVFDVQPDVEQLKLLGPLDVVVTARGTQYDFVSRYFWPANGGVEDPVTGSIHAGLAPYWSKQLNKTTLLALQASQRQGVLYCEVTPDHIKVSGYCVNYLEGNITFG